MDSLGGGGAEKVSSIWSNYWIKEGHEVSILILSKQQNDFFLFSEKIKKTYIKYPTFKIFRNLYRIFRIRKIIKNKNPDLIISLTSGPNVISILANLFLETKLIVTEHTYPPLEKLGFFKRLLKKYIYYFATTVIVLTKESQNWIVNNTYSKDIRVINNPIEYPIQNLNPYKKPPDSSNKFILNCGRLHYEKGQDMLITAFSLIEKDFPEWSLYILGEGMERNSLQNLIYNFHLEKRIFLPGWAGNLHDWYSEANIFAFSSRFEGFGNALAEAKMYGKACISFDCLSGPREIISNRKDGILVTPNDIEELSSSLKELMENKTIRHNLSLNAIKERSKFSVSKTMLKWDKIFSEFS